VKVHLYYRARPTRLFQEIAPPPPPPRIWEYPQCTDSQVQPDQTPSPVQSFSHYVQRHPLPSGLTRLSKRDVRVHKPAPQRCGSPGHERSSMGSFSNPSSAMNIPDLETAPPGKNLSFGQMPSTQVGTGGHKPVRWFVEQGVLASSASCTPMLNQNMARSPALPPNPPPPRRDQYCERDSQLPVSARGNTKPPRIGEDAKTSAYWQRKNIDQNDEGSRVHGPVTPPIRAGVGRDAEKRLGQTCGHHRNPAAASTRATISAGRQQKQKNSETDRIPAPAIPLRPSRRTCSCEKSAGNPFSFSFAPLGRTGHATWRALPKRAASEARKTRPCGSKAGQERKAVPHPSVPGREAPCRGKITPAAKPPCDTPHGGTHPPHTNPPTQCPRRQRVLRSLFESKISGSHSTIEEPRYLSGKRVRFFVELVRRSIGENT